MKTLDNGLSRAEFEYLYDTDNEEPETDKSPEYEAQEWLKEVYYAYQERRWILRERQFNRAGIFPQRRIVLQLLLAQKKQNHK